MKILQMGFKYFLAFMGLHNVFGDWEWNDHRNPQYTLQDYLDQYIRNRNTYNAFLRQRHKNNLNNLRQNKPIKDCLSLFASLNELSRKKLTYALILAKHFDFQEQYVSRLISVLSLQEFNNFTIDQWVLFFRNIGYTNTEHFVAIVLEMIELNGYERENGPFRYPQNHIIALNRDYQTFYGSHCDDSDFVRTHKISNWTLSCLVHCFAMQPVNVRKTITETWNNIITRLNIFDIRYPYPPIAFGNPYTHRIFEVLKGYNSIEKWPYDYENFWPIDWEVLFIAMNYIAPTWLQRFVGVIIQMRYLGPNYNGMQCLDLKKFYRWRCRHTRIL